MSERIFVDGVLREFWDDSARTYTVYDEQGQPVGEPLPYTAEENAAVDAALAAKNAEAARREFDRAIALTVPDELAALQAAQLATEGITDGSPWRQPSGAHDAYPLGATVEHAGTDWESLVAANVWEPGDTSNPVHFTLWKDLNATTGTEWDPNGHAYTVGYVVTYQGTEYRCLQAHTSQPGWDPVTVPSLWTLNT